MPKVMINPHTIIISDYKSNENHPDLCMFSAAHLVFRGGEDTLQSP